MSKEDYVSLEVAKMLKEKGYPQEYNAGTICRLQNKANQYYEKTRKITQSDIDNAWCIFNEVYPTLYEASKWLRENHDIDVLPTIRTESPKKDYCCYIYKNAQIIRCKVAYGDDFYECMNDGLLESLKLI